jgi:hypothetical protein
MLVWTDGEVTEKAALDAIQAWVKAGGILCARVQPETVEGEKRVDPFKSMTNVLWRPGAEIDPFFAEVVRTAPDLFPDGVRDQVYWSRFEDGSQLILNYSAQQVTAGGQKIEPGSIGHVAPK